MGISYKDIRINTLIIDILPWTLTGHVLLKNTCIHISFSDSSSLFSIKIKFFGCSDVHLIPHFHSLMRRIFILDLSGVSVD